MIWILLILPLVFLFPFLGQYIYAPGSKYSDLLVSHVPNALYLKNSLIQYGQIPLWSNSILSGYPFAANPLSGLWYPPGWLAVILPVPFGFNLTVILHLLFGGLGIYLFLREHDVSLLAACLGAILFEAMPKIIAHFAAGHVTLVYAVSWTPWLLLLTIKSKQYRGWKRYLLGPGLILGVIFLADPRWAAYAGIIWLIYSLWLEYQERQKTFSGEAKHDFDLQSIRFTFHRYLLYIGSQVFIALVLAAPLLFPLLQYTNLSTRSQLSLSDIFTLSLPPDRLLGLIFPAFGSYAEWVTYYSAVGLVFFLLALLIRHLQPQVKFWAWVFLVSMVISLGNNLPGLNILGYLPGFNLLRVPTRILLVGGIALACLVPFVIDHLSGRVSEENKKAEMALVGISGFTLMLAGGIWYINKSLPDNFLWGAVAVTSVVVWVFLRLHGHLNPQLWISGLLVMLLLDLTGANYLSIAHVEVPIHDSSQEKAVAELASLCLSNCRVYSPSYSIPQDLAVKAGLQLADGVDPLQLKKYQTYMVRATGVDVPGYSVTLPAYASGDPITDNIEAVPDAQLLGRLNVGFVAAEFPLDISGLKQYSQIGSTWIYQNLQVYPRAWVSNGDATIKPALITKESPNEITVRAEGPGTLTLSEIDYPGWVISMDGSRVTNETNDPLLRSLSLPAGNHEITFSFHPWIVYAGLGFGITGWIMVLVVWLSSLVKRP